MKFQCYYPSIMLLFLLSCTDNVESQQQTSQHSTTPEAILTRLLAGEMDAKHNAVKWKPTPGDIEEYHGQISNKAALFTIIDTVFKVDRELDTLYYIVFRTAPMITDEDGGFVNSNSCHACGVNLGYFSYTVENDSIYINKYKRNFATHGSFGNKSYLLSLVNLGDGYEYLKVDDHYEGMGTHSVTTVFYQDGNRVLSMISDENNKGNRERNEKGYYEFRTVFSYDKVYHKVKASQTGFKIDEYSGKKIPINIIKVFDVDSYTWQF